MRHASRGRSTLHAYNLALLATARAGVGQIARDSRADRTGNRCPARRRYDPAEDFSGLVPFAQVPSQERETLNVSGRCHRQIGQT
jgi:hypothetical protein